MICLEKIQVKPIYTHHHRERKRVVLTQNPRKCKRQLLQKRASQEQNDALLYPFFTRSGSGRHAAYSKLLKTEPNPAH